jgi:hypothetical protein
MKEEARQSAGRDSDLPAIFHKPWQAENPVFLLGRTRQTDVCHCSLELCVGLCEVGLGWEQKGT